MVEANEGRTIVLNVWNSKQQEFRGMFLYCQLTQTYGSFLLEHGLKYQMRRMHSHHY